MSSEFDPDKYLAKYCTDRNIDWDLSDNVLRKRASQSTYLDLFEEYFGENPGRRLPTMWGMHDVDDPSTNEGLRRGLREQLHCGPAAKGAFKKVLKTPARVRDGSYNSRFSRWICLRERHQDTRCTRDKPTNARNRSVSTIHAMRIASST